MHLLCKLILQYQTKNSIIMSTLRLPIIILSFIFCLYACSDADKKVPATEVVKEKQDPSVKKTVNDIKTMLAKKQVPVLCYHQIREFRAGESSRMYGYVVTPSAFADQMKTLHDSGYTAILPDQLHNYLLHDEPLPSKPVMITFDDTREEHHRIGAAEMKKYGYKGVYFIMTISINRPKYMSEAQLKELSDSGHAIASHTWDHHMVTKYAGADYDSQFQKPKDRLEKITGKPVKYFAYPFGLWNQEAIPELNKRGYEMAFILSTKRDSTQPLYTVRRMIVPGDWTSQGMLRTMKSTFK